MCLFLVRGKCCIFNILVLLMVLGHASMLDVWPLKTRIHGYPGPCGSFLLESCNRCCKYTRDQCASPLSGQQISLKIIYGMQLK